MTEMVTLACRHYYYFGFLGQESLVTLECCAAKVHLVQLYVYSHQY